MRDIQNIDDFRQLASSEKPFCAVFSAEWCPDCQVLKAVLPGLEEEYGDRFNFAVVDRDTYPGLAEEYDVLGIPSFIVIRNNDVAGAFMNRFRKTRRQITDFLEGLT